MQSNYKYTFCTTTPSAFIQITEMYKHISHQKKEPYNKKTKIQAH